MNSTNRNWLSPCGLDCSTCNIHLRTDEELAYWKSQGVDPETIRCDGCRSDRGGDRWSPDCEILECCVYKKGLDYCAECSKFICSRIKEWGARSEHHTKAVERLSGMKEKGIENWLLAHSYE
jgi:hypothetical protein